MCAREKLVVSFLLHWTCQLIDIGTGTYRVRMRWTAVQVLSVEKSTTRIEVTARKLCATKPQSLLSAVF
jgi:hypothetical protein